MNQIQNVLITSAGKQIALAKEIIAEAKETDAGRKVYTCDMYPESVSGMVESDGCFKVPICTSEDYVETIFSLCLGYDISHIITMTEREFIILSANKEIFGPAEIKDIAERFRPVRLKSGCLLNISPHSALLM